ncbi:Regulator of G-protein signaling 11 [Amphibalanus amphitrite]|uniref:Regulator of G-protein signaling 11 n=1 Tax=Amphibalanus amphitrite TaxID=1232801 RepID=A0A6A4VR03_AMPAM|nr:Regulator of G-protein signaling 11 [Amphibalanus amphitrite]
MEKTQKLMKNPSRFTFDQAADHVYELLLKKDCYPRFLRSEHYGNLLTNAVNPTSKKRQLFSFGGVGKKKTLTTTSSKLSLATGTATRSDQEQTGNCAETPSAASAGIFLGVSPRAVSLPKLTLPSPSSPLLSPAGSTSAPVTSSSPRNGPSTAAGPTVAASSSPAAQQRHRQPEETGPAVKTAKKKDKTVSWTRHF